MGWGGKIALGKQIQHTHRVACLIIGRVGQMEKFMVEYGTHRGKCVQARSGASGWIAVVGDDRSQSSNRMSLRWFPIPCIWAECEVADNIAGLDIFIADFDTGRDEASNRRQSFLGAQCLFSIDIKVVAIEQVDPKRVSPADNARKQIFDCQQLVLRVGIRYRVSLVIPGGLIPWSVCGESITAEDIRRSVTCGS